MAERRRASQRSRDGPDVGTGIRAPEGVWTFGSETPSAFDEHIASSIPAYRECHDLIIDLADQMCPVHGRCYDLGCSTGLLTARLSERLAPRGVEVIGVDRDPGMIARASRRLPGTRLLRFVGSPIEQLEFARTDLAACFYTLQFVPLPDRAPVLTRLRRALEPHGALILFEKILASTGREQDTAEGAYFEFKRRSGFSNDEIVEKRRSLRGVLQPLTASENYTLLQQAGFTEITHIFRWLSFDGVIAYPSAGVSPGSG